MIEVDLEQKNLVLLTRGYKEFCVNSRESCQAGILSPNRIMN